MDTCRERISSQRAQCHTLPAGYWANCTTNPTISARTSHPQSLPQQNYMFSVSTVLHCHSVVSVIVVGREPLNYSGRSASTRATPGYWTEAQSTHLNVKPTQVALDLQVNSENSPIFHLIESSISLHLGQFGVGRDLAATLWMEQSSPLVELSVEDVGCVVSGERIGRNCRKKPENRRTSATSYQQLPSAGNTRVSAV